ncbi:hypothetical protein [Nocardiopsis dassonvillei]|uniref:hypothetical protein n=1 Tax=Nocardiopsis dassonvillei TaxID=2014 RepID=UPI00157CAAD8|nr:hypothetical protein [Nocardiopsis dassonvillei]
MSEYDRAIAQNRANWDQRADVHARSAMYDVDGLIADPSRPSPVVRNDLAVLAPHLEGGTVAGRSLLHLQCHIGTDTVCWARLGAMDFEPWQVSGDYLSGGGANVYEDAATYTDGPADSITQTVNHEWRHDLAEVTGALLEAGLVVEALGEHPFMDWPAFSGLVECPQGWRLPEGAPRIPLNFSVVARRPG